MKPEAARASATPPQPLVPILGPNPVTIDARDVRCKCTSNVLMAMTFAAIGIEIIVNTTLGYQATSFRCLRHPDFVGDNRNRVVQLHEQR